MSESLQAPVGSCSPQSFEVAQGDEKTCAAVERLQQSSSPIQMTFSQSLKLLGSPCPFYSHSHCRAGCRASKNRCSYKLTLRQIQEGHVQVLQG